MRHPDDDDWMSGGSAGHLRDCPSCRAEHERMEAALAGFRKFAQTAPDRPDYFWERQRLAIRDRLSPTPRIPGHRSIWAWASAAVVVVLGIMLFPTRAQPPAPDIAAGHDQDLLLAVERSLNRDVPKALAPALLLTEELDAAASRTPKK